MSKKKKIIILSCMVALLALTAVLNFVLTSGNTKKEDDVLQTATYFAQYKTERSASRSEQLVQLNEVITSAAEESEAKQNALNMKLKLTKIIEDELHVEQLIAAQGYPEAVVSIGLTSDNINVVVKDADFTQDDATIIYSILSGELNATPENVNIFPVE